MSIVKEPRAVEFDQTSLAAAEPRRAEQHAIYRRRDRAIYQISRTLGAAGS
jgi:hypothetical protein